MKFPYIYRTVLGLAPVTPNNSSPTYISLKNVLKMTVIITAANTTGVTGSAITLQQATAVDGTGAKSLAFNKVMANVDASTSDVLAETAVTGNTFTTTAAANKNSIYVIDVPPDTLDTNNAFDCVRVNTGNATAQIISVLYVVELRDGVDKTASTLVN